MLSFIHFGLYFSPFFDLILLLAIVIKTFTAHRPLYYSQLYGWKINKIFLRIFILRDAHSPGGTYSGPIVGEWFIYFSYSNLRLVNGKPTGSGHPPPRRPRHTHRLLQLQETVEYGNLISYGSRITVTTSTLRVTRNWLHHGKGDTRQCIVSTVSYEFGGNRLFSPLPSGANYEQLEPEQGVPFGEFVCAPSDSSQEEGYGNQSDLPTDYNLQALPPFSGSFRLWVHWRATVCTRRACVERTRRYWSTGGWRRWVSCFIGYLSLLTLRMISCQSFCDESERKSLLSCSSMDRAQTNKNVQMLQVVLDVRHCIGSNEFRIR